MHPGAELTGKLEVADIGFPEQVVNAQNVKVNWTTAAQASQWMPRRPPSSHKGSYGRVLGHRRFDRYDRGGCPSPSEAALRAGAGLVTLATRNISIQF